MNFDTILKRTICLLTTLIEMCLFYMDFRGISLGFFPVDTRRRFNVYKTSIRRRGLIDVETTLFVFWEAGHIFISFNGSLHLAKFAIANIVQVLAQVIRKAERSKIHIAQV